MKRIALLLTLYSLLTTHYSVAQNKTDEKGRKQGYWEKVDPSTKKIIYKGTFKDDKPQGLFIYYHTGMDTVHTKMDFRQDGKIGYATLYYFTGKMEAKGKYVGEQKDSVWTFYDGKGVLISTETFTNGKKNGIAKIFFSDGKVSEEKIYKDGKLTGPFKQYFNEKAVKAEGSFINDNYTGKCIWYYPNGVIAAQGIYDNNVKKGVWIYKETDGKLKDKEIWVNGKQLSKKDMEEYLKKNKTESEESKKPAEKPGSVKKPAGKK
jgi:antitoxin component YwqK of YwqJK toxin-antitoxin module